MSQHHGQRQVAIHSASSRLRPHGVRGVCEGCPKDQELFGDKATPLDLGLPELCSVSPGQDPESGPDPFLEAPGGVGVVRPSPNAGGTL